MNKWKINQWLSKISMGATIAYACGRETHVYTIDTTFLLYLQKKKIKLQKIACTGKTHITT